MAYKNRLVSEEILALRILHVRMKLSADMQKYLYKKEKGLEGELQFDLLTEKLQSECLILNDLLLEVNNSKFQLDTTIIFQETICPFDVKNFEGDLIFKNDKLETISGREYLNPLGQLNRSNILLGQLLQNFGYTIPIEGSVVFVNPEFTLYQCPPNVPFILPTQLNKSMKKLDAQRTNLTNWHKKLADKLVSLHQTESPYDKLPAYTYGQLRKGNICKTCHSFKVSVSAGRMKLSCDDCGFVEDVEGAVLRCVEEIRLLFPVLKITTNVVHEWCGGIVSKKQIKRILMENYTVIGKTKYTYYE